MFTAQNLKSIESATSENLNKLRVALAGATSGITAMKRTLSTRQSEADTATQQKAKKLIVYMQKLEADLATFRTRIVKAESDIKSI